MPNDHAPLRAPEAVALAGALDRVGDRWSLLVIDALLGGASRYGELAEAIPAIAPNVLADRLRRLERAGLIAGTPYSRRPVRFAYAVTPAGAGLAGSLRQLAAWGAALDGLPDADAPAHAACGTPLELRWHCPTCDVALDDPGEAPNRLL